MPFPISPLPRSPGRTLRSALLAMILLLGVGSTAPVAAQSLADTDLASASRVNFTLTIRTRFSPYEWVRYEFKSRGSAYIAVLTKQLVGGYGELQSLALVPDATFSALIGELGRCGFDDLQSEVSVGGEGRFDPRSTLFDLEVHIDDYHRRILATDREVIPGSDQWCVVETLRNQYDALGDPVTFENDFFNEGEFGELTADSEPGARVWVDGVDTGVDTPLHHFRLAPGVHTVRFVNEALGIDREYEATIMEGITTRLHVELR